MRPNFRKRKFDVSKSMNLRSEGIFYFIEIKVLIQLFTEFQFVKTLVKLKDRNSVADEFIFGTQDNQRLSQNDPYKIDTCFSTEISGKI